MQQPKKKQPQETHLQGEPPDLVIPAPQLATSQNDNNGTTMPATNETSKVVGSMHGDEIEIKFADWGFKIDRLFEVAHRFYKRNESKAFYPTFDERNQMVALVMQAKYGNHDSGRAPDVGALDLVGKRRRYEWSLLKGMSKTEAMSKFICALDDLCPIFKAHAEAVKISSTAVQNLDVGKSQMVNNNKEISTKLEGPAIYPQLQNIYSSLCKQTYNQFKGYAEKQFPNDGIKQKFLVTSLQDQYYQQYISQMHPELIRIPSDNLTQASNTDSNELSIGSPEAVSTISDDDEQSKGLQESSLTSSGVNNNLLNSLPTVTHVGQKVDNLQESTGKRLVGREFETNEASLHNRDLYSEDNNIQTDVSSEELNSGQDVSDAPVSPRIPISAKELDSTQHIESISTNSNPSHKNGANHSNTIEPVKLFSNSGSTTTIGMFESFPEPKLIKNVDRKSTPINQINPNITSISNHPQDLQVPTLSNIVANGSERENPYKQSSLDYESTQVLNQPTTTPRKEEIYKQQDANPSYLDDLAREPVGSCTNSTSETCKEKESGDDFAVDLSKRNQGPELWDCMSSNGSHSPSQEVSLYQNPEPATIWSKREVVEFKESLGDDKQGGIYEVKESTLVIIQVPTYPDGKYIYWEFATDDFDIGFGLDFAYEKDLTQPLALTIYEDLDDDEEEEQEELDDMISRTNSSSTVEMISGHTNNKLNIDDPMDIRQKILAERRQRSANTISIVPTYRRDSHQEVFVGRHKYPGQGYYLLRFDNTYSIMRSKTLYFRICYFM